MSIISSTYKPLFNVFQVLYKERSVVREAYIDILYDSRQRRVNFTVKIAYQVYIFFCIVMLILRYFYKTTTPYLGLFYGINPQPYLISAFSMKLIAKLSLFLSFLWIKIQIKNLENELKQLPLF